MISALVDFNGIRSGNVVTLREHINGDINLGDWIRCTDEEHECYGTIANDDDDTKLVTIKLDLSTWE